MQLRKQMRQSLRRLKKTVVASEQSSTSDLSGASLAAIGSALSSGAAESSSNSGASARKIAAGISADIIRGAAPPKKLKKLRYSFNSTLRETRLAEDLEDLTDDEEEQLLGIVEEDEELSRPIGRPETEVIHEDDETGEMVEESGMKKASNKPLPKKLNHITEQTFRDGAVGLFDSDPALKNPKNAHRKAPKKGRNSQALAATTADDYSGTAKGAKASYRFWGGK